MTYEYICTGCGNEWEAEQSITASPLKKCPSCGEAKARRQISGGTGFVLKGGGWYADGYGSARPASASTESGGSSKTESKATTTTSTSTDGDSKAKPDKPKAKPVSTSD